MFSIKCSIEDPDSAPFRLCCVEFPTIQTIDKFVFEFIYYDFKPNEIDQSNYSSVQKYVILGIEWAWNFAKAAGVLLVFLGYLNEENLNKNIK